MFGVTLLSCLVWQHHLFVSGINSDLRPFYMLSTELISIPTGFTFLCGLMTLWRGQIRFTVPMLFCLAWFFNFLIGGLSGVFLSDVPSDVTTHGSFFSMAHFHYTIMGGLIFTFFAAIYYWVPKMTGFQLNERLGKIHFWSMFLAFNSTFAPLFAVGFLGQPRRVVTYPQHLQFLNDWVSVSAFVLGLSMLVFLFNLVYSLVFVRMPRREQPVGLPVARVAAALAGAGPRLRPDPGHHGRPVRLRRAPASRLPLPLPRRHRRSRRDRARSARTHRLRRRRGRAARAAGAQPRSAAHLLASATAFFFLAFVFAYFYLRSLNNAGLWQPKHVDPSLTLGHARHGGGRSERAARAARARRPPRRAAPAWRVKGAVALALGLAAVVLQVVEWTTSGSVRPTAATRASSSAGRLLRPVPARALFWLETMLATSIRYRNRRRAAGARRGVRRPAPRAHDIRDPLSLVRAGLEALSFYWGFLAGSACSPGSSSTSSEDWPLPIMTSRSLAVRAAAPPLLASAVLYWRGGRRHAAGHGENADGRAAAFYAGLAAIVIALDSPLDSLWPSCSPRTWPSMCCCSPSRRR